MLITSPAFFTWYCLHLAALLPTSPSTQYRLSSDTLYRQQTIRYQCLVTPASFFVVPYPTDEDRYLTLPPLVNLTHLRLPEP